MQKFTVTFDEGQTVDVELKSRDLARLEIDGQDIQTLPPVKGSYLLAFTALQRMDRAGLIDFKLPADVDGLIDCADIESEDDDAGEGSGQAADSG